jgi:formylglycine-generating enzyme required for sulfatase activity
MADRPPLPEQCAAPLPPEKATLDLEPKVAHETASELPRGLSARGSVGRFAIRGFLGAGTFGVVHRAHDPQLDREVALKVAPAAGQSPERMQRFRREARTAAGLRHPHIVPLFEAGEADGMLYLASAFIPGVTLADALARSGDSHPEIMLGRGTFDPRDAAAIAQKLADALAYAHGQGVLHRDVKAANVMLDPDGEPHLLDFGLARRFEDEDKMTQSGTVLGTPAYLAPEVCRGDPAPWTPAVDQYALGVLLYELLTRQTPFGGPTEAVLALHQMQEPEPPSKKNPIVPRDLEAICLKCLEKEPAKRYPDCAALADDLRRWLDGLPTVAKPLSTQERLVRWARRNPSLAGLYATLLAVVVGTVVAAFAYQRAHEAADRRMRAAALVEALGTANIANAPLIVGGLQRVGAEAEPLLREKHAAAVPGSRERFRYALALLPTDPSRADELLEYVPTARAEDVLVLREGLRGHAEKVTALWPRIATADPGPRLRFAALLAVYLPADDRWHPYAASLAEQLIQLNPLELAAWAPAVEPLHGPLTPALLDAYTATQHRLEGGDLGTQEFVAAASQFDLTATLLARAATDKPTVLAELLMRADPRHHSAFLEPTRPHSAAVVALLRTEAGAGHTVLYPGGSNPKLVSVSKHDTVEKLAARRANAVIALLHLGEADPAWALLRHTPDPTARSYLIHGLAPRGADPLVLMRRYEQETDISARRALLLALGEYEAAKLPAAERERLTGRLLDEFCDHPDAGLHAAIAWLLRQKWGKAADLDRIISVGRGRPAGRRDWFVNKEGQTFIVIRDPAPAVLGSPPDEPGREEGQPETPVRTAIPRSFAIAARKVTVAEYLRFNEKYKYKKQYARATDGPINDTTWYEAAAYCRWLSEQEGVAEDQMCYPKVDDIKPGMTLPANFLDRTGYRLPTEAEWEYACRAGAVTVRPYGCGTDLLDHYGWSVKNSRGHLWPCGQLKPNDFGLFDTIGNAWDWCQDQYAAARSESDQQVLVLSNDQDRLLRGGTFLYDSSFLRSAQRYHHRPDFKFITVGFRPARTYR